MFRFPLKNVDFRVIGIKGSFYYEDGDFRRFRENAGKQHLISGVTSNRFAYNFSLISGYEFSYKNNSFGLDGSSGITYIVGDDPSFLTMSLNLHYSYKRCTAYLLHTESIFGIRDEYAIGLIYRLK
ncbi:MAG: hypothetical protein QM751_03520 [Paludibacteraceae bacterium]